MPPSPIDLTGRTVEDRSSSNVQGSQMQNDLLSDHGFEQSSDQTLITSGSLMDHAEHYPFVTAAATTTIQASTTPFTIYNLDQHNQQQEEELNSIIHFNDDQRLIDEHVEDLRLTLQSLGVDEVPDYFLIEMALKYDGMVSMERLWAEHEDFLVVTAMREEYYSQNNLDRELGGYGEE